MNEIQILPRDQVESKYKINLALLFKSEEEWKAEMASIDHDLRRLAEYRGKLSGKPSTVADTLDLTFSIKVRESKAFAYAELSHLLNTADPKAAANYQSARALRASLLNATSYIEPELLQLEPEHLRNLHQMERRLEVYQHYFENLSRTKPYILSEGIEGILAKLANPFSGPESVATILLSSEISFEDAHASDNQAVSVASQFMDNLTESSDSHLRRSAVKSYIAGLHKFKNTLSETFLTSIKQAQFKSQVRGHSSALTASLFEDNLSKDVFENVISCAQENRAAWHRYWKLRRRALDLREFTPADIWAPLSKNSPRFSYEDGLGIICNALAPLGEDYTEILKDGCIQQGWVDVYPTIGKIPGWMSLEEPGAPPYVILQYTNSYLDLSGFAHELGHSMHSFYAHQSQPMVYKPYSMLIAEVPSNLHQVLLRAHLIQTSSDRATRLAIINDAMAFFHRYLLVMPMLASFELEVHKRVERGEGLSAEDLIHLYADLVVPAYGDEVVYDYDDVGMEWASFLHLYMPFYTFKYTIGISASYVIAKRLLEEGRTAATEYFRFLKAGSSVYPVEALRFVGVDVCDRKLIDSAFSAMANVLDELEALL